MYYRAEYKNPALKGERVIMKLKTQIDVQKNCSKGTFLKIPLNLLKMTVEQDGGKVRTLTWEEIAVISLIQQYQDVKQEGVSLTRKGISRFLCLSEERVANVLKELQRAKIIIDTERS